VLLSVLDEGYSGNNNRYPFFKYHQNDKVAKTERLSIEGKKTAQLRI
jgi:hypothetical protein